MTEAHESSDRGIGRSVAVAIGCVVLVGLGTIFLVAVLYSQFFEVPEICPDGVPPPGYTVGMGGGDGSTYEQMRTTRGDGRLEIERTVISGGKPTGEIWRVYRDDEGPIEDLTGVYHGFARVRELTSSELRKMGIKPN